MSASKLLHTLSYPACFGITVGTAFESSFVSAAASATSPQPNTAWMLSARDTASSKAWLAPCPLKGLIGCAASPTRVTRENRRSWSGRSGSRSYTGPPVTSAVSVRLSISGIGACHPRHRRCAAARSASGRPASDRASLRPRGNENCHIVCVGVNGITYIRLRPSTVSKTRSRTRSNPGSSDVFLLPGICVSGVREDLVVSFADSLSAAIRFVSNAVAADVLRSGDAVAVAKDFLSAARE